MITPNRGIYTGVAAACLVELSRWVPESEALISTITIPEKAALQEKIADLLQQVLSNENSFKPEQSNNLLRIRELAKKAEQVDLLSKPAKAAIKGIAAKTKEIGLSLYTTPLDFTIQTRDGAVEVNSDLLKANSSYFKKMFKSKMQESTTRRIELTISTRTIEFLINCLHDPSAKPIVLPADNALVLELVEFAMNRCFDTLIQKLEPAVAQFIAQQRDVVVENGCEWVHLLTLQKNWYYPSTAAKWLADLTPLFLAHFDIPCKLSELSGLFEIPIEHQNVLFAEEARDLLKQLPLVLVIKNEKDLDHFKTVFQETTLVSFLPITVLCRMELSAGEEESLYQLAKASHIELSIKKPLLPPGTVFFGKEHWDTYLGYVEDVPLPAEIKTLLESPCPYFPGHTWKDKFMLFLKPKIVDGQPVTSNHFMKLVEHPKGGGRAAKYEFIHPSILTEHGEKAVERSEWVLMSMDVIEGSREEDYEDQKVLVAEIPGCEVPDLLSAHIGIFTHFIHTGERLYPKKPRTYTYCQETTRARGIEKPIYVGYFYEAGLSIYCRDYGFPKHFGMGVLRRFP